MLDAIVGWDIGGAHLKAARLDGRGMVQQVLQLPCPLWQGLPNLERALDEALRQLPTRVAHHAITMTGELVDLFANRAAGVRELIASVATRLPAASMNIYAGRDGFVGPEQGAAMPEKVASANWMATGAFVAGRIAQGLVVDMGSTTTDIIPVRQKILAGGLGDHDRLVREELVYTGATRTPIMAVARRIPFEGSWVPLMAEHFATMADVYRLSGGLMEHADQMPTADGRGKSVVDSARRLARMLGRDVESASLDAWRAAAAHVAELQQVRLLEACARNLSRGLLDDGAPLIGAGVGRFVVAKLSRRLDRPYVDFSALVQCARDSREWAANCAPAVAVAGLIYDSI
jgi:probable H4MPT-linked C1 transfer pathway protein